MTARRDAKVMSLADTWGYKPNLGVPYLMAHEVAHVRQMLDIGALTAFKMMRCAGAGCDGEVPICRDAAGNQLKTHCSRACYERSSKKEDDDGGDEGDGE